MSNAPRVITVHLKLNETARKIGERTKVRHRRVLGQAGWPYPEELTAALWREEVRMWANDEWPKAGVVIRGRQRHYGALLNACMGLASMATGAGLLHPNYDDWTSWWSTTQLAEAMLIPDRHDAVEILVWLVRCHRLSRTPGKVINGKRRPDQWRLILAIRSNPFGASPNTNVPQRQRQPIGAKAGSDWGKSATPLGHVEINNPPNSLSSLSSLKDIPDDDEGGEWTLEKQNRFLAKRQREADLAEQEARRRR